jgi:hypothetical protein
MNFKKLYTAFTLICMAVSNGLSAQFIFNNSQLVIQSGAEVIVKGNATTNADISGAGVLKMKGDSLQTLNMNGFAIQNLAIDNATNIALLGDAVITGMLTFTTGKIQLGANNLTVTATGSIAETTGDNTFAETNGIGLFKKEINAIGNYLLPVGTDNKYKPVQVQITGSPVFANAFISARSIAGKHPNKPYQSTDYLNEYWTISNGGITGGSIIAAASYHPETVDVTGQKDFIRPVYWNGSAWITGNNLNRFPNSIAIPVIAGAKQDLYGMNQFVLLHAKALLQGAYNASSKLMNDKLRNSEANSIGNLPTSNIIPTTDPYRSAPYNFTHTNNALTETVVSKDFSNPFIDQLNAENNIVDWVFVELRSAVSPGNTVIQTRSALIQRDGDIVELDGESPLYFKNIPEANYTVAIKHRNHLAMCTNPATFTQILSSEANTPTLDFTSLASSKLMGTAGLNYFNQNGSNFLYAGNTNLNGNIRWNAPYSDKDYILNTVLSKHAENILLNSYSEGDIDLNREVRWSAPNSDIDFLFSIPLSNSVAAVKSQALPN